MGSVLDFVVANWVGILGAVAAVHAAAVAVVNLTPTPKDDAAVASVYAVVEKVAGIISPLAKK